MAQISKDISRSHKASLVSPRTIGWLSLARGTVELLAARKLARWFGMERNETLIRAFGASRIAAGIGLLARDDPTPWMRVRLVGDALDLAVLGRALMDRNAERDRVAIAFYAVAGITLGDALRLRKLRRGGYHRHNIPKWATLRERPNM
ncbi:hypothetical protein [Microvirga terricola]|uniref:Cyclase dehydrase n=1 Tax=Microvirga terricola TaxID=2719797 RepID=A0ABX0VGG6_9HYPH|nr:hypothetical protein [Microvirga terricola]NIX78125.1 hypothetical protein [Microvirga terricola]